MIRSHLRRAVLAAALAAVGVAALAAPAGAAAVRFVATGGAAQATIVDLSSRTQDEAVLSFTATLLRRTPARLSDLDAYWGDGTLQIDCLNHLTRWKVTTGYNLDRTRRFDAPAAAFGAWSDDAAGTVARELESYVCHGVASPDVSLVADLTGFARAYLGGQSVAQASGAQAGSAAASPPPPAQAAAAAAPGELANFYMIDRDANGAELVDMSVRKRKGAVARLRLYRLEIKPIHFSVGDYHWQRYEFEVDCAGHRERRAPSAFLSFEDHTKVEVPHPKFFDWEPIYQTGIEPLVCDQAVKPGVMAVGDLEAFQRWFLGGGAGPP